MRKIKTTLIVLLLMFLSPVYSQSEEEFKFIGSYDDGTEIYIKIEKEDIFSKEVWIKQINPTVSKKNKNGKYVKSGGDIILRFIIMDCENKTYDQKDVLLYSSNGKLKEQNQEYEYRYGLRIVPSTNMDEIRKKICE